MVATRISASMSSGRTKRTTGHGFSTMTSDEGGAGQGRVRAVLRGSRSGPRGDAKRNTLGGSTVTEENELGALDTIALGRLEEERGPGLAV